MDQLPVVSETILPGEVPHRAFPADDPLALRAEALIAAGRTGAARPLLAALAARGLRDTELARLSAWADLKDGRIEAALAALDGALETAPDDLAMRRLRAEARLAAGLSVGAAADAAEVVVRHRADPAAKALLGVALLQLGHFADAAACLAEAVQGDPENAFYRQSLAAAQEAGGDVDAARASLAAAIAAAPLHPAPRGAAMLLEVRQGRFAEALALGEAAAREGAVDACVFGLRGHALSCLGRHEEAAESYQQSLRLGPDDPYVRHLVASSGRLPGGDRAPDAYVRAVFEGCASRFDAHLIALGYRVPGLIRAALVAHPPAPGAADARPVLDLGCGTGLLAVACCDLSLGPWCGVDLSPAMLAEARAKELYAELHEAELLSVLATDERRWPVVLAGDVLCYFGALEPVLAAVAARLAPGGLFVFSVEAHEGEAGWSLGPRGRYSHARPYVAEAAHAAGFEIVRLTEEALRCEAGAPVPGLLAVLAIPR